MRATLPLLDRDGFPPLGRIGLEILQVNLGYRCNMSCLHCHVNAGPNRKEMMGDETMALLHRLLESSKKPHTLDLTGGAPEMHERFKELVIHARKQGCRVIDRCNLTVLHEPGQEKLAGFLSQHQVEVVASLPCYQLENVDSQRGKGAFEMSIASLMQLNSLGYGQPESGLILNLVYNPQGPTLPPAQLQLQSAYKRELFEKYGVVFNRLLALSNMPIQRFGSMLISKGLFNDYMRLLKDNFSAENLDGVMCRNLVSVDWEGYLYDCDFNQQLGLSLSGVRKTHLRDLLKGKLDLEGLPIRVADHCYGCTAGQGSSCSGAVNSQGVIAP